MVDTRDGERVLKLAQQLVAEIKRSNTQNPKTTKLIDQMIDELSKVAIGNM